MVELVLDGPGKNALSMSLMEDVLAQMDAAEGQPLLLRGRNGALSAGVNLKELITLDAAGTTRFLELLDELTRRLYLWPRPTVALLDGHAIAGGCVVALACDLRIAQADPKIRIGLTEVAVGVQFPPAAWKMIAHRIPTHTLDRVLLEAKVHSPDQALALGLIDQVSLNAEDDAVAALKTLARYDAPVYAATKAALRGHVCTVSEEEQRVFLEQTVPVWTSPELRARLQAFLTRKK